MIFIAVGLSANTDKEVKRSGPLFTYEVIEMTFEQEQRRYVEKQLHKFEKDGHGGILPVQVLTHEGILCLFVYCALCYGRQRGRKFSNVNIFNIKLLLLIIR